MALHNVQGKAGEEQAVKLLEQKGYRILHRNWRSGHKELDIVALQDNTLVICEVKTRKNTLYGNPEDAVTDKKIRRIVSAADAYIRHFKLNLRVRFDIITVVTDPQEEKAEHIEDAFYPPIW